MLYWSHRRLGRKVFAGIDLTWNYNLGMYRRKFHLTMDGYIGDFLIKYGHINPTKPQISSLKHHEIQYGTKYHMTPSSYNTHLLNDTGIKLIQGIIGSLLYYGSAVKNKPLVGLSSIFSQKYAATKLTNTTANQLLI